MFLWSFMEVLNYYCFKTEEIYFLWPISTLLRSNIRHKRSGLHLSPQCRMAFTILTPHRPAISKSTLMLSTSSSAGKGWGQHASTGISSSSSISLKCFNSTCKVDPKNPVREQTLLACVIDPSIPWHHESFLLPITFVIDFVLGNWNLGCGNASVC